MSGSRSTISCGVARVYVRVDWSSEECSRWSAYAGRDHKEVVQGLLDRVGHVVLVHAWVFELVDHELRPAEGRVVSAFFQSFAVRADTRQEETHLSSSGRSSAADLAETLFLSPSSSSSVVALVSLGADDEAADAARC